MRKLFCPQQSLDSFQLKRSLFWNALWSITRTECYSNYVHEGAFPKYLSTEKKQQSEQYELAAFMHVQVLVLAYGVNFMYACLYQKSVFKW